MHCFFVVGPPYTLRLKVKFYSSEPNTLREELTRYQFFLQLKQDMLEGRLHSKTTDHNPNINSFEEKCAELCALSLQCKCLKSKEKHPNMHEFTDDDFYNVICFLQLSSAIMMNQCTPPHSYRSFVLCQIKPKTWKL